MIGDMFDVATSVFYSQEQVMEARTQDKERKKEAELLTRRRNGKARLGMPR